MNNNDIKSIAKKICDYDMMCLAETFPFLSIEAGLSWKGGTIWNDCFGNKRNGLNNKIVPVHSLSKLYTMFCCIRSSMEGKLDLHAPITHYLPDLKLYYQGENVSNNIIISHLLSHMSGLQHEASIGNNFIYHASLEEHINSIQETTLMFMPGYHYAYSNIGYNLLGFILCKIYQDNFASIMHNKVFNALNMTSVSYSTSNQCQHPSSGMQATMVCLMNGINNIILSWKNKFFISPKFWREIFKINKIYKEQISGYGYAVKVFRSHPHHLHCITGQYRDFYAVQMFSEKLLLGYTSIFYGFTNEVRKALNTHDAFFNTVVKLCSKKEQNKIIIHKRDLHIDESMDNYIGSYLSYDNNMIFIKKTENNYFFSKDGVSFIKVSLIKNNHFSVGDDTIIANKSSCGKKFIYYNGTYEFGTYFYNGETESLPIHSETKYPERIYELAIDDEIPLLERNVLMQLKRFKRIRLIESVYGFYINYKHKLIHISGNTYEKATGESVVIEKEFITIGNIRYNIINKGGCST